MAESPLLIAFAIPLDSPILTEGICKWQFGDPFVIRLLKDDIPQRVNFGEGRLFAYKNRDQEIVGFGTIDVCEDYMDLTGRPHPHIPLLAVKPDRTGNGYGIAIVEHLIAEAAIRVSQTNCNCHDVVFLEVYTDNIAAISLYTKCGFTKLNNEPIPDEIEGKDYFIMARRVSVA